MKLNRITNGKQFLNSPIPLFLVSVFVILLSGRYKTLWEEFKDPIDFLSGIFIGILCYYGTNIFIHRKVFSLLDYSREIKNCIERNRISFGRIAIKGGKALFEETFWRGTVQYLLGNGIYAVAITSIFFTLLHIFIYYKKQPLNLSVITEFFLFSFVLGVLYMVSQSLLLIATTHTMRNVLIHFECLIPKDEINNSYIINKMS